MPHSNDFVAFPAVLRALFVTGSIAIFAPSTICADSIRPWGGAVLEAKDFSGGSVKKEGPDQTIALNSAMRYDWHDSANGGRDMKSPYSVEYLARISNDSSKLLTIRDSFQLPGRSGGLYRYIPHPLDSTLGQDMESTYATAQWNGDSVRIKNPAGQSVPDRVRLVFELGIASQFDYDGWKVMKFGDATVKVNDKSMTISSGSDVKHIGATGLSGPFRNSRLEPGERVIATPGSSLANLIEGDLSYPTKSGENLRIIATSPFDHRDYLYGRFSVDLDVNAEGWSEEFSAEIRSRTGIAFDRDSWNGLTKYITLGLVDVTTIDGESLDSLGYELEFASGLVLTRPTIVPEPSSIAVATVLIVAGLIHRKRQNRHSRTAA